MKFILVVYLVAMFALISYALLSVGEKPGNYQRPLVYDVCYRSHNYLVFRVDGNVGQTYVHDPDCPCGKSRQP